jgi:hypothetical protein
MHSPGCLFAICAPRKPLKHYPVLQLTEAVRGCQWRFATTNVATASQY